MYDELLRSILFLGLIGMISGTAALVVRSLFNLQVEDSNWRYLLASTAISWIYPLVVVTFANLVRIWPGWNPGWQEGLAMLLTGTTVGFVVIADYTQRWDTPKWWSTYWRYISAYRHAAIFSIFSMPLFNIILRLIFGG